MFRVVTVQSRRLNGHRNGVSRFYKSVKYYSQKNDMCPPKAPRGGTGTMVTLGGIAVATGATIGYAKYDPEFRSWLKDTAPFTDDVIRVVCQEEKSYLGMIMGAIAYIKDAFVGESEPFRKAKPIKEEPSNYQAPSPVFPKVAEEYKQPDKFTEIRLEEKVADMAEPVVEIVDAKKLDLPKLPVEIICDLEKKISADATLAIQAFSKSLYALKNYNCDVEIIVEESVERIDPAIWNNLRKKTVEKDEAIREAQKYAAETLNSVNKLKAELRKNSNLPENLIERTKINITKVQDDINNAKNELDKELKNSKITDKYWSKVEQARKQFSKELEALFPTINFEEKNVTIKNADMDLFILHAMSQVLFYQKELHKLETVADQRLTEAIEVAKKTGHYEALTTEQICGQLEKEKRALELQYQNKCLKLRQESESDLRNQLKLQSEAFTDHLEDAVRTREMEMERSLNRKFDEQLTEERCKYKMQVSAMVGRLRGLEEAMKVKADADKTAQQAQILWSACQALFKSVKVGCPGLPWVEQIRPLKAEISAVKHAAETSDELVKVVLESIPEEANSRGVFPEDALRERFLKVERVARDLALLPENGGRLHLYFLSYLQSMLLLTATNPIPAAELNDENCDFSKLSTNDILQRARYWLDRGDFAQTLKYMNLLDGAPRSVAKQWMNEARILLETQQAANTLMAYAAAGGLMYL